MSLYIALDLPVEKLNVTIPDFKANVLIKNNGSAALCDFGLAHILEQSGFTATGGGTSKYLAPEAAADENRLAKSSTTEEDVYSFAMTALEVRLLHLVKTVFDLTLKFIARFTPARRRFT